MPRVLVDLRMVGAHLHGIARYALELAAQLPALAPDLRFEGLTGPAGLPPLGPLAPPFPLRRAAAGFLAPLEQPALLAALVASRCELFHATSFSVPLAWPGRLVATLHDANHLVRSTDYGPSTALYYRFVVRPRVRRARALATVSRFSAEELTRALGLPPDAFAVIPPGVAARFLSRPTPEGPSLRPAGVPGRYFLAVGNPKRHKNLGVLARIAPQLPLPLVLLAGTADARSLGFPASTRALRDVPEEQLPPLYAGASALLLPSRYEGFGLPALEAMASGCPVVAARAGALPELMADAGLLVEPDDAAGWLAAAASLVQDPALALRCAARGRERASGFSWETCARRTVDLYRHALGR